MSDSKKLRPFEFLTNHGLVLLCIAEDPGARLRDIADQVGITERAAHRIVGALVAEHFAEGALAEHAHAAPARVW